MKAPSDLLLLFSGGLDSTAIAATLRPKLLLFVDYGQRPASAELTAATNVARVLELPLKAVTLGIGAFGSGLLHDENASTISDAPSPEWWPYRNQFLATAGAAVALQHECSAVALGSVKSDGERHKDGTPDFYEKLDGLIAYQEGSIRVTAPAIGLTTEELLDKSSLGEEVLGWTTSCHRSNLPCGNCPGCWKRQRVLATIGIPGYTWGNQEG